MEYVGPQDDGHGHDDHHEPHDQSSYFIHPYEGEPKTMADFVKPEYR
jgi:cytochrome c oxidase subunit 5b